MRRRGGGPSAPWVLGLACSHDGAACLLRGGRIVAAVREERLSRRKRQRLHAARPSLAVRYCLEAAGLRPADLDLVVAAVQGSRRSPLEHLAAQPELRPEEHGVEHRTIPHHLAHAASAAALSGWDEAAVLVLDGIGSPDEDLPAPERAVALPEAGWEIASLYAAAEGGAVLTPLEKHLVPGGAWLHGDPRRMRRFGSLGGLYAAASWQIFGDHQQPGKVMALAALGTPEIPVEDFFSVDGPRLVFSDRVPSSWPPGDRWPDTPERAAVLAASVQRALEEGVLHHARRLREVSGPRHLAYAGGVALNGLANERVAREAGFDGLFVVPAADDAGTAVGAAYWGLAQLGERPPRRRLARDETGRRYGGAALDAALAAVPGLTWRRAADPRELVEATVDLLVDGRLVGWFQGGSELGPRALGQRSILADPRRPEAARDLNARVKHREPFRPFAPAVLAGAADDWFEAADDPESPFMLRIRRFRPERRPLVPAVVHADGTGRLQTVTPEPHGLFHDLVAAFARRTGVPLVLNTSFNGRGEPIVEAPADALWCLLATGLDACVLGDRLVERAPGVRSLLDLVPRRAGARPEVHTPGGGAAGTEPFVVIEAATPWGPAPRYFGVEALAVLEAVDGRRTGRELHAALAPASPPGASGEEAAGGTAWIVETLAGWSRHAGTDGHLPGGHSPLEVVETLARERGALADEGAFTRLLARLREAGAVAFRDAGACASLRAEAH